MAHKKGQLSVDFYVALVIFLGFLAYITFQLFQTVPESSANVKEETIRIDAYQISELLINNAGYPLNWEIQPLADVKGIGFSDPAKNMTNYLLRAKLDRFNTICQTPTGYQDIKKILEIRNEMTITFIEHTLPADTTWVCKSSVPTNKKVAFNVSRTVSVGGISFGEIIVEVWKI